MLSVIVYFPLLFWVSLRLLKVIKTETIQVVHVNDLYNMTGIIIKKLFPSVKLIYHIRLLESSYASALYSYWKKAIVKSADEIICVSNAVRKAWPNLEKVHVLHDALPEAPNKSVQHGLRKEGVLTFLYLANYVRGKGHEHAIKAFASAWKELPSSKLVLAGGDLGLNKNKVYKEELVRMTNELRISDRVVFKDFVSDIGSEMIKADIFLNFSDAESFSMTCLESLYYGVPCIATDCGGPSEIIVNGYCGMLVPVADVNRMSTAMLELANSPKLRVTFAENGRTRVKQFFMTESQKELLRRVYGEG